MAKMTKADRIAAYLESKGAKFLPEKSTPKRRVYSHISLPNVYYFIGRNGGLRRGRCYSDSFSLEMYVEKWQKAGLI